MNAKSQRVCAWFAPIFCVIFGVGWAIFAGFVPPPPPGASAEEIATLYRENTQLMRLGFVLMMAGAGTFAPLVAVLAVQMKRIEGQHSPYTYTQIITGAAGILILLIPAMTWTTAAFRPERDAELILLLNDLGWLLLTPTFGCASVQNLVIGLAIFADKRAQPIFPRWFGFLNIWVAVLFLPAGLIPFFKAGPFAWDGIIAFWLPAVIFFVWVIAAFLLLLKAITRQEEEAAPA